jgi:hypothetical protein
MNISLSIIVIILIVLLAILVYRVHSNANSNSNKLLLGKIIVQDTNPSPTVIPYTYIIDYPYPSFWYDPYNYPISSRGYGYRDMRHGGGMRHGGDMRHGGGMRH